MARLLISFASSHLSAAVYFARSARDIEKEPDLARWTANKAYAVGAVISAVAFLEATINEVFSAAVGDGGIVAVKPAPASTVSLLAGLWPHIERLAVLDKYDVALTAFLQSAYVKGAQPYQRADLLVRLRNALVHARANWVGIQGEREGDVDTVKLGRKLQAEFPPTNLIPVTAGNPFFPDKCLGAGCAKWAVDSARALTDDCAQRVGISFGYHAVPDLDREAYSV